MLKVRDARDANPVLISTPLIYESTVLLKTHTHTHTHTPTVLTAIFPGEPELAGFHFEFLPRDAMLVSVCQVCLPDMLVYCIQLAKYIVKLFSNPRSPIILVY